MEHYRLMMTSGTQPWQHPRTCCRVWQFNIVSMRPGDLMYCLQPFLASITEVITRQQIYWRQWFNQKRLLIEMRELSGLRNPALFQDSLASLEREAGENGCTIEENEVVIQKFNATVRTYFRGPLKLLFNEAVRKAAGSGPQVV